MLERPDAIVLCGGAGSRLKAVTGEAPKAMAAVAGRPFLELLLHQLRRNGVERVILAVGYRADAIRAHFGDSALGLRIAYSIEDSPLGTGGALRRAVELAESQEILVMNGDSYTDADLPAMLAAHQAAHAAVTMLVVPVDGRSDCGTVAVGPDGRLNRFLEKQESTGAGYINAGIYLMSREGAREIPPGREVSLEREVFPNWVGEGRRVRAFIWRGDCVDIGTPERYRNAQELLRNAERELLLAGEERKA
jgi:NDP-sugar pyrophosphorylase family protein